MSRLLQLGYRRKIHPAVYADDLPESSNPLPKPDQLTSSDRMPNPEALPTGESSSSTVNSGLALMQEFLENSLSPSTITEYQVCPTN